MSSISSVSSVRSSISQTKSSTSHSAKSTKNSNNSSKETASSSSKVNSSSSADESKKSSSASGESTNTSKGTTEKENLTSKLETAIMTEILDQIKNDDPHFPQAKHGEYDIKKLGEVVDNVMMSDELQEEIKRTIRWQEWSRYEYECSAGPAFPKDLNELTKIDCYWQAEPNMKVITEMCIARTKEFLKEKKNGNI